MAQLTPTQALVEIRLGGSVLVYLTELRLEGLSWREVADELYDRTGVAVSHEALRQWCGPYGRAQHRYPAAS